MASLSGKNILLGVTGGIAAYKALELTRLLVKEGASVWPVMTASATEFITPLSLSTLSGRPVLTGLFDEREPGRISHIELADKADLIIIAPATANIIGKIASGIADDLLTTLVMAAASPILIAPAMNRRMYSNPVVQANIQKLAGLGYHFVGPSEGELACGDEGKGRLSPPEEISESANAVLSPKDFAGERVLVTAGPTREMIDPVRFLSNASSGMMGYALARAARRRGADVTLVSGPVSLAPPVGVKVINVTTADEMREATMKYFNGATIAVMTAAVSDFRPATTSKGKIKKSASGTTVAIEETVDILAEMGAKKGRRLLVGFALETSDMVKNALLKLKEKNLDMIVANGPEAISSRASHVTIITGPKAVEEMPLLDKDTLADRILDFARKLPQRRK